MPHDLTIAGRKVTLVWDVQTSKAFAFRLSEIGFEITPKSFSGVKAAAAVCKCLWALLPDAEAARYASPEKLFVAMDHETESGAIFAAISAIFAEMNVSAEKKSTLTKSPSPESNSD
jgi:hypothetical protein